MSQILAFQQKVFEFLQPHLVHVPLLFSAKGSIVVMFLIVYMSKYVQVGLSLILSGFYDNVQASFRVGGKGTKKDTWREKTVQRAFNAHQNQWEAFIGFSIAVILALINIKDTAELDILVNAFIISRVVYNVVYVLAFNPPLSILRSVVWLTGISIVFRIFYLSVSDVHYHA